MNPIKTIAKKYEFKEVDERTTIELFRRGLEKLWEALQRPYWVLRLKSFGKGSVIKRGVLIIPSHKRLSIGKNTVIFHRCILVTESGRIELGNHSHLGVDAYLNATKGAIIIGNHVAIGPRTQIYSYSNNYEEGKNVDECHKVADVIIKDNVLIGASVVILPGITISEGAIVGAGSVVTKDIQPFTIVGGIPAKIIKERPK